MVKILKIYGVEKHIDKHNKLHYITHVLLDDGDEATGWGHFSVGQRVERWHDLKWDKTKIKKIKPKLLT